MSLRRSSGEDSSSQKRAKSSSQRFGLCERRVDPRRVARKLFLDRLPLHDVLVLGQVAEHVEVAEPIKLAVELAAAGGVIAAESLRFGADDVENVRAHVLVRLEVVQPFDELRLERLGLGNRLAAAFRVAAGRAEVAADAAARAARAVHACAATLAVQELEAP